MDILDLNRVMIYLVDRLRFRYRFGFGWGERGIWRMGFVGFFIVLDGRRDIVGSEGCRGRVCDSGGVNMEE